MEHRSLSCKSAGVDQGLARAPSSSRREVLSMTESSAAWASPGKRNCPCAVQFRFIRLIHVLYQIPGRLQHKATGVARHPSNALEDRRGWAAERRKQMQHLAQPGGEKSACLAKSGRHEDVIEGLAPFAPSPIWECLSRHPWRRAHDDAL